MEKQPFYGDSIKGRLTTLHRGSQKATMTLGAYKGLLNLTVYPNPPRQGPGSDGPKRITATFNSDQTFLGVMAQLKAFYADPRQTGEYSISLKAEKFVNDPESGRKKPKMLPSSTIRYGRDADTGICWIMVKEYNVNEEVRFDFHDNINFPEMFLADGSPAPVGLMSKAMALGWIKKMETQYGHHLADSYAEEEAKQIASRRKWQEERDRRNGGGGGQSGYSRPETQSTPAVNDLDDDIYF